MGSDRHDVIIIGGGPAGSAAALTCQQLGLKALVIDEDSESRTLFEALTPSQSVHPGLFTLLDHLGVNTSDYNFARNYYSSITRAGNRESLSPSASDKWFGAHIDKSLFCKALRKSIASGRSVEWVSREKVSELILEEGRIAGVVALSGNVYESNYVVDASGSKRICGRRLNLPRKFMSPPLVASTAVSGPIHDTVWRTIETSFEPDGDGWVWLAPGPSGFCTWTRVTMRDKKEFLPPTSMRTFPLAGKMHVFNVRWFIHRPLVMQGLVLCGDAAASLDPASGQGILLGIQSGIKAIHCVKKCLDNPSLVNVLLAEYDQEFLETFYERTKMLKTSYQFYFPHWFQETWNF